MNILGISAFYHDSAAALLVDGNIVACAQEERFTRKKHDSAFPEQAIRACLQQANLSLAHVHAVAFYDKPLPKFERLLETYLAFAPRGFGQFVRAMPVWLKDKLFINTSLQHNLAALDPIERQQVPPLLYAEHHQSHAASAFYPSPFSTAAVLCLDGVGEWATTSAWQGTGARLEPLWELQFPHSLGLLYSAFTAYAGFKVNSGEYKLMGLAPYGQPTYVQKILDELLDLKSDGTFRLNLDCFAYTTGLSMTNARFDALMGGPPRQSEGPLLQHHMDLARSIQEVTEEVVLRLGRTLHRETGAQHLCMAGGVALNCVANGRLLREGPFRDIWIQPAAGDAGGALGAALSAWHGHHAQPRSISPQATDSMRGGFLGPCFDNEQVAKQLQALGAHSVRHDPADLLDVVVQALQQGCVVGWFQGRMEFGPRALGGRSILGDPRAPHMQSVMNLKIKYRESFRPFAPAVLLEDASTYFELDRASPYMLLVAPVSAGLRCAPQPEHAALFGIDKLQVPRSSIPAVTHVDYSSRVQTVDAQTNPRFHALLRRFKDATGCSVLVNTSFNVRGEPIVGSPADAYRCFMRTEMDLLVIEDHLLHKASQPPWADRGAWKDEFVLD